MTNQKHALDALFEAIHSLSCQMFPHQKSCPSSEDPYDFEIFHDPEAGELIRSRDGNVEAFIDDLGEKAGLRSRYRPVVLTVYPDDVDWKEFSTTLDAARWFLLEQFRMRISGLQPAFSAHPRTWPTKIRLEKITP